MEKSLKHTSFPGPSPQKAGQIAGIALVLMFFAAMFAEIAARQALIVPDNAGETAQRVLEHPLTFRFGLLAYLIVGILDVIVAWGLYMFLKPTNDGLAQLAAWLRMLYVAFLGAALPGLVAGFRMLSGAYAESREVQSRALEAFNSYEDIWMVGMVFFGLHLVLVGFLCIKSGLLPRVLGILLLAAGLGYALDSMAFLCMAGYADYKQVFKAIVALPAITGELGLAIWLIFQEKRSAA